MSKLDKYEIRTTMSGEIVIAELDKDINVDGLFFIKDSSYDKSNDAILAVMKFLENKIDEGDDSITVSSGFGELTFTKKEN